MLTPQANQATDTELESEPASRLESESRLESSIAARVVLILADQVAGITELARLLGHKSISGALHRQIRYLLDKKVLEMTIPDKPSSRLQQ